MVATVDSGAPKPGGSSSGGVGQSGRAVLTTADGTPLKASLARATRRAKLRALLLVMPLFLFLLFSFIIPIADMATRSVANTEVQNNLPRTGGGMEKLGQRKDCPAREAFAGAGRRPCRGARSESIGQVATRLNYEIRECRSNIMGTVQPDRHRRGAGGGLEGGHPRHRRRLGREARSGRRPNG